MDLLDGSGQVHQPQALPDGFWQRILQTRRPVIHHTLCPLAHPACGDASCEGVDGHQPACVDQLSLQGLPYRGLESEAPQPLVDLAAKDDLTSSAQLASQVGLIEPDSLDGA